jgi:hypothetical protein
VTVPPLDADSLWKEVLERFLPDFLAFCLPAAHAGIDWARGYQFLDKELQEVAPAAAVGRRVVDALVQVWRRDGAATWVLIHIEVQGREEAAFARRMVRLSRPAARALRPAGRQPGGAGGGGRAAEDGGHAGGGAGTPRPAGRGAGAGRVSRPARVI